MPIVQHASGTFNGTSFTPTLPAASSASNIVVLIVAGNTVINTPTSWTLRTSQVNFMGHYLYDRAGVALSSVTVTNANGQGTWWIGEIAGGAHVGSTSTNVTAGADDYSTPALTPTVGNRIVLASIASVQNNNGARTVSGWTNSFVEQADLCYVGADYPMQGVAALDNVTADGSTAYSTLATFSNNSTGRSAIIAAYATSSAAPAPRTGTASGAFTYTGAAVGTAPLVAGEPTALLSESWTGTNGASWPAAWTLGLNGTATIADIQSNQGRLRTGTAAGGYTPANKVARRTVSNPPTDFDVTFRWSTDAAESYPLLVYKAAGTSLDGLGQYEVDLSRQSAEVAIRKVTNYSGATIGTAGTFTRSTAGTFYWCRLRVNGGVHKVKLWAGDLADEPVAGGPDSDGFQAKATDTTYTTGRFGFALNPGGGGQGTMLLDDLVMTDGAAPGVGSAVGGFGFAGAAAGKRSPKATASRSWAFTGTAVGRRTARGATAGVAAFVGTATGRRTPRGVGAGAWLFTAAAVGERPRRGVAAGGWGFAGAAVGDAPPNRGVAAGSVSYSGLVVGKRRPKATVVGVLTYTGVAAGDVPANRGVAAGSVSFAGAAVGARFPRGSASGGWGSAGDAVGKRAPRGTAGGEVQLSGSALGHSPAVGIESGTALGETAYAGTAVGVRRPEGTAFGSVTYSGFASGDAAPNLGAASGAVAYAGTAEGQRPAAGAATGAVAYMGAASGASASVAVVVGEVAYTGAAAGRRFPKASAYGDVAYVGAAEGVAARQSIAVGVFAYVGAAVGYRAPVAVAAGVVAYAGSASDVVPEPVVSSGAFFAFI